MSTELTYLAWVAGLTAFMWIPYILNEILVWGIMDAVGYPENPKPLAPWAQRMKKAHYNAVENLVVFASLVLVAHAVNATSGATAMAAMWYFWLRVVHFLAYTFKVPWVRTLAFIGGFVCQAVIAWEILF